MSLYRDRRDSFVVTYLVTICSKGTTLKSTGLVDEAKRTAT